MTTSLVIFDMDGTLIDSSRLLANAINYVRSKLHLAPMPPEQIIGQVNNHHVNPAQFFYEVDQFEPRHETWFSEYYTAHHDQELELYDGVLELLTWLREQGSSIALATNAHRISALESLRHLQIERFFDAVVCHDDVEQPKPEPDMLFSILHTLNISQESAMFIGDGPRDKEAAHAAGIKYVMVDWGYTEYREETAVENMEELRKEIMKSF